MERWVCKFIATPSFLLFSSSSLYSSVEFVGLSARCCSWTSFWRWCLLRNFDTERKLKGSNNGDPSVGAIKKEWNILRRFKEGVIQPRKAGEQCFYHDCRWTREREMTPGGRNKYTARFPCQEFGRLYHRPSPLNPPSLNADCVPEATRHPFKTSARNCAYSAHDGYLYEFFSWDSSPASITNWASTTHLLLCSSVNNPN